PSGTGQCIYGGAMDNDLLRNPWWQMQQKQACIAAEFDSLRQLAMPGSEFERLRSMFGGGQPLRENPRPRPPQPSPSVKLNAKPGPKPGSEHGPRSTTTTSAAAMFWYGRQCPKLPSSERELARNAARFASDVGLEGSDAIDEHGGGS